MDIFCGNVNSLNTLMKFMKQKLMQYVVNRNVDNPLIEQIEFIDKIWPQNCGDNLKILNKILISQRGKNSLFECEFQKYPN